MPCPLTCPFYRQAVLFGAFRCRIRLHRKRKPPGNLAISRGAPRRFRVEDTPSAGYAGPVGDSVRVIAYSDYL